MNVISKLFDKVLNDISDPEVFLSQYLEKKFKEIQINLNKEQLIDLTKQLYPSPQNKIKIDLSNKQLSNAGYASEDESKKDIKLIFDGLVDGVGKSITEFTKKLPDVILNSASEIADFMLKKIEKDLLAYLVSRQTDHTNLINSIDLTWGDSLDLLEALIGISLEVGEIYNKEHSESFANNYLNKALIRLHARACQTSSEIITLLRSGYADGANARWRSLHEILIISFFISEHGNDIAERYLNYEKVESYKAVLQFQEYAEKLGHTPIGDAEMEEIISEIRELDSKYGIEYKKGGYGWASSVLNTQRPTFRHIEESIDQDHMRPYYKMASYNVHAGAKSLFFQLGIHESNPVMLAGPSNLGLVEPCRFTATSLSQITINLILQDSPNMDLIVASKMLMKLERKIESIVIEAEKTLLYSINES